MWEAYASDSEGDDCVDVPSTAASEVTALRIVYCWLTTAWISLLFTHYSCQGNDNIFSSVRMPMQAYAPNTSVTLRAAPRALPFNPPVLRLKWRMLFSPLEVP